MIVFRTVRKIKRGKVNEYLAQLAKIEARWQEIGAPPLRQYQKLGTHLILADREFESFAALEDTGRVMQNDPELNALRPALHELIEDQDLEFYTVL